MQQRFTLLGKDALIAQLKQIPVSIDEGVSQTLKSIGDETRDRLRDMLRPGDGIPSDPLDAPHSQTGKLKSAIYSKLSPKLLGMEILLTVGVFMDAYYGWILEKGAAKYPSKKFHRENHKTGYGEMMSAKLGQRLLPRPWFWPTLERFWADTPVKVEQAVSEVLSKYEKKYSYDPYTGNPTGR